MLIWFFLFYEKNNFQSKKTNQIICNNNQQKLTSNRFVCVNVCSSCSSVCSSDGNVPASRVSTTCHRDVFAAAFFCARKLRFFAALAAFFVASVAGVVSDDCLLVFLSSVAVLFFACLPTHELLKLCVKTRVSFKTFIPIS
jgi:hypothetical protein